MKNILEHGTYIIGSPSNVILSVKSEIISLKIRVNALKVPKCIYSLDDLRDLESKLVLITGQDSPEIQEVHKFHNVSYTKYFYFW